MTWDEFTLALNEVGMAEATKLLAQWSRCPACGVLHEAGRHVCPRAALLREWRYPLGLPPNWRDLVRLVDIAVTPAAVIVPAVDDTDAISERVAELRRERAAALAAVSEVEAVPLEPAGEVFDPFRLPTPVPWFPKRRGE